MVGSSGWGGVSVAVTAGANPLMGLLFALTAPCLLVAVTLQTNTLSTAASVSIRADLVAPAIFFSLRSHWYLYVMLPSPLHVPDEQVSSEPGWPLPRIAGRLLFGGRPDATFTSSLSASTFDEPLLTRTWQRTCRSASA